MPSAGIIGMHCHICIYIYRDTHTHIGSYQINFYFIKKQLLLGQGENSANKVHGTNAGGSMFESQDPCTRAGMVVCICHPSTREVGTGRGLTELALPTW